MHVKGEDLDLGVSRVIPTHSSPSQVHARRQGEDCSDRTLINTKKHKEAGLLTDRNVGFLWKVQETFQ